MKRLAPILGFMFILIIPATILMADLGVDMWRPYISETKNQEFIKAGDTDFNTLSFIYCVFCIVSIILIIFIYLRSGFKAINTRLSGGYRFSFYPHLIVK